MKNRRRPDDVPENQDSAESSSVVCRPARTQDRPKAELNQTFYNARFNPD